MGDQFTDGHSILSNIPYNLDRLEPATLVAGRGLEALCVVCVCTFCAVVSHGGCVTPLSHVTASSWFVFVSTLNHGGRYNGRFHPTRGASVK